MSASQATVYALTDPRSPSVPKYIGVTSTSLAVRLNAHIYRKTPDPRGMWVASLISQGLKPLIWKIEDCPIAEGEQREKYWIEFCKASGSLLNLSNWGSGHYERSEEHKQKLRALNEPRKKRIFCPETGEVFESIKGAARSLGIWENTIRCAIKRGDIVGSRTPGQTERTFQVL